MEGGVGQPRARCPHLTDPHAHPSVRHAHALQPITITNANARRAAKKGAPTVETTELNREWFVGGMWVHVRRGCGEDVQFEFPFPCPADFALGRNLGVGRGRSGVGAVHTGALCPGSPRLNL